MRYYFDILDGDSTAIDDEGLEFPSRSDARKEAARALSDLARDIGLDASNSQNGDVRRLAIKVRDADGLLLHAGLTFEFVQACSS